jgi:uncharacterized protein
VLAPEKSIFDDLLAQGATAVANEMKGKVFYINVIKNITKLCDCEADSGEIIAKDVGIVAGESIVAVDRASVDLIEKQQGKNVFLTHNHKDPRLQINFAMEHLGLDGEYQLKRRD